MLFYFIFLPFSVYNIVFLQLVGWECRNRFWMCIPRMDSILLRLAEPSSGFCSSLPAATPVVPLEPSTPSPGSRRISEGGERRASLGRSFPSDRSRTDVAPTSRAGDCRSSRNGFPVAHQAARSSRGGRRGCPTGDLRGAPRLSGRLA